MKNWKKDLDEFVTIFMITLVYSLIYEISKIAINTITIGVA